MRSADWTVVVWVLFIKIALLLFGFAAVQALANRAIGWEEMLNRWDALRYLQLARDGYASTGEARFSLVGFPLYPWVVRGVAWVVRDISLSAFLVSGVASIGAGLALQHMVRRDYGEILSRYAVWFLFIYPTSYFLHLAYTEALLLVLALCSFIAARKKQWLLAGVLGGFAAMTRMNGLILLPAIAFEAWQQYRETRRFDLRWLWLGIIPGGFVVYLWLNFHVTGDALAFTQFMDEKWSKRLAPPWTGIESLWHALHEDKMEYVMMVGIAESFFTIAGLLLTVWGWFNLRASYSVWMTGNMLLSICSSWIVGVPRYTLVMFPIFILLAMAANARTLWFALISSTSLLLLALFVTKFALGHWTF